LVYNQKVVEQKMYIPAKKISTLRNGAN